jgi:tryptophanyl-tRNA synthetase
MTYDQPLKNISFDGFDIEKREEYKNHLKPENAIIFRNSAAFFEAVEKWLAAEYPGGEFVAGRGKDGLADALIVVPKIKAEVKTNFSNNVQESKLAKMKSKFGRQ